MDAFSIEWTKFSNENGKHFSDALKKIIDHKDDYYSKLDAIAEKDNLITDIMEKFCNGRGTPVPRELISMTVAMTSTADLEFYQKLYDGRNEAKSEKSGI